MERTVACEVIFSLPSRDRSRALYRAVGDVCGPERLPLATHIKGSLNASSDAY